MKMVAKNQNVRSTRCGPMMLSSSPYRLSTSHSRKFCAPVGTCVIFRVATRAKTMRPSATIHVTTMEFVIGKAEGPCDLDRLLRQAVFDRFGERPKQTMSRAFMSSAASSPAARPVPRLADRRSDQRAAESAGPAADFASRGPMTRRRPPPVFRTFSAMPEACSANRSDRRRCPNPLPHLRIRGPIRAGASSGTSAAVGWRTTFDFRGERIHDASRDDDVRGFCRGW